MTIFLCESTGRSSVKNRSGSPFCTVLGAITCFKHRFAVIPITANYRWFIVNYMFVCLIRGGVLCRRLVPISMLFLLTTGLR